MSMSVADVLIRVHEIEAIGDDDPEAAHGQEDNLHQDVLRAIAGGHHQEPAADLARVALRTRDIKFSRWYA